MANDQLKNGDALKGELQNLTKKNTALYLIDNDGIVYSHDTLRQGNRFEIGRIAQSEDRPMPQLVLTLSSDKPIPGSLLTEPAKNTPLFQQLNEAITAERLDVDYGFAFFMLGGSWRRTPASWRGCDSGDGPILPASMTPGPVLP